MFLTNSNQFNRKPYKIFLLVISIAIVAWFMVTPGIGVEVKSNPQLAPVEIKEYQGEKLSSNADFFENSIKGPQYLYNTREKLDQNLAKR